MEEINLIEEEIAIEIKGLSKTLSSLSGHPPVNVKEDRDDSEKDVVETAIDNLDDYSQER